MNKRLLHSGFALMDVLLAVILIVTISVASYEMINTYHDKANVQTVESDLINIAQAYAPLQNQTAIESTSYDIFYNNGGSWIAKNFLKSVPIPESRMSTPVTYNGITYVYLSTNLLNKNGQTLVGFEKTTVSGSDTSATFNYFLIGLQVNYAQAVQLIQDLNGTFSIFVGGSSDKIRSAKPATSLPKCTDKDCVLNLYLVTPSLDDTSGLEFNFLVPPPK